MSTQEVIELINAGGSLNLSLAGFFTGGEVGAADVRDRDGSRFVLKWWEGQADAGHRVAELVETLRRNGYPAPRFAFAGDVRGVTVMPQEFVAGRTTDVISDPVIDRLLELNSLQVGRCPNDDPSWTTYMLGSLRDGCDGYCLHQPLRDYSQQTRSLLETIRSIGTAIDSLPAGDVVHIDFHHRNVLIADDQVTAVIDWEGCRAGDATFDLVTLAFGLTVADVSTQARERVWREVCERTIPTTRRAYAAHMALRQVDWSIRHRTHADVDRWLTAAREFLGA